MRVLSPKAQLLLFEIKKNKKINFKDQETFNNQLSFNRVIRRFLQAKLIFINWDNGEKYELTTIRGEQFVKTIKAYAKY